MCKHLEEAFIETAVIEIDGVTLPVVNQGGEWHIFREEGCIDNHTFLVCDICGDVEDIGDNRN